MTDKIPVDMRHQLVAQMVDIVASMCGHDFDFVLVVRAGCQQSYVMTDVSSKRARSLLLDALNHPDAPS